MDSTQQNDLLTGLDRLSAALEEASFPLALEGRDDAERARERVRAQLVDYLLPRARSLESPLTVVVGGSTGAGKSTLVNSVMHEALTRSGVVRPTTRWPVLLHHPEDAEWVASGRILPSLRRSSDPAEAVSGGDGVLVSAAEAVPAGIALIDAPDIDSVSEDNRRLSRQLLDAADVWMFVTTANRYADAVPWEVLERAAERNIALAVVLNRVPDGAAEEILEDLSRMLAERGLRPSLLLPVLEQARDAQGLLPAEAVARLGDWLAGLGADAGARRALAARSLAGAVAALDGPLGAVDAELAEQSRHLGHLLEAVRTPAAHGVSRVEDAVSDGTLMRGEVMARWQDFVGTGEFFRRLEKGVGRLRDRLGNYLRGNPKKAQTLEDELETGLYRVVLEEAARAREDAQRAWYRDAAGRALLGGEDLGRLPEDFPEQVKARIRAWQQGIIAMMSETGAQKRQRARFLSAGVNSAAVLLMIVVFSMTGGLTGIEIGIAGGAGALGWKILEAVFGEDAVRRMAARAREDLLEQVRGIMDEAVRPLEERLPADPGAARQHLRAERETVAAAAAELGVADAEQLRTRGEAR